MSSTYPVSNSALKDVECEDTCDSGIIWSAIFGGAVTIAAFLLLLAPLAAGLGLSWTSPWYDWGHEQKTLTLIGAVWLILVQWVSAGMGGYVTGRLRTSWYGAHEHEVFFRDTVHGFLTWALTSVAGVLLLAAGISHMAGPHGVNNPPPHMASASPQAYAANKLFRSTQAGMPNISEQDRADVAVILSEGSGDRKIPDTDRLYLIQLVEARTGLSPEEAANRVENTLTQMNEAEKVEHKNLSVAGMFIFLSMWIGAFIASVAAGLGGQHRDTHYATGRLNPPA